MVIIDKLELGIIYDSNGKIINHRSLIKVIFNPFLRIFGINITTLYYLEENRLSIPIIQKCGTKRTINFLYKNEKDYKILKRRIII